MAERSGSDAKPEPEVRAQELQIRRRYPRPFQKSGLATTAAAGKSKPAAVYSGRRNGLLATVSSRRRRSFLRRPSLFRFSYSSIQQHHRQPAADFSAAFSAAYPSDAEEDRAPELPPLLQKQQQQQQQVSDRIGGAVGFQERGEGIDDGGLQRHASGAPQLQGYGFEARRLQHGYEHERRRKRTCLYRGSISGERGDDVRDVADVISRRLQRQRERKCRADLASEAAAGGGSEAQRQRGRRRRRVSKRGELVIN